MFDYYWQRLPGGTITISGAVGGTGNRAARLNGTFEMTSQTCNGMPMYQKKGDPDTWLDMCKTKAGGWRWYIKPANEKGPDSSICFGYGISDNIVFPHECKEKSWYIYDGSNFVIEESIVAALSPGSTIPDSVWEMRAQRQAEWLRDKEGKIDEVIFTFLVCFVDCHGSHFFV